MLDVTVNIQATIGIGAKTFLAFASQMFQIRKEGGCWISGGPRTSPVLPGVSAVKSPCAHRGGHRPVNKLHGEGSNNGAEQFQRPCYHL